MIEQRRQRATEGVDLTKAHGKSDMAVKGSASDLMLFVWNRPALDLQTFGEPDVRTYWSSKIAI